MSQSEPPVILVDGTAFLFRSFYALPPLSNSQGLPTGAIFGTLNMLVKLFQKYKSEQMAVVFDHKGKNFRHQLFPEYKAHRPPIDESLRVQIEPLQEVVPLLGLPMLVVEGVEADDVIGTLATQATQQKRQAFIASSDKDMAQLVSDDVFMVDALKDKVTDRDGVIAKFGVTPEQIIDYLSLVGDSADNVPGVDGVGPKTAAKWLSEYKSLENLLEFSHLIKGKVGENLRAGKEKAMLSKQLTTIKTDCVLDFNISNLQLQEPDFEKLAECFAFFEFNRWLTAAQQGKHIFSADTPSKKTSSQEVPTKKRKKEPFQEKTLSITPSLTETTDYQTITNLTSWKKLIKDINQSDFFAFDTETTGLDTFTDEIVGLSFSIKPHTGFYVPLKCEDTSVSSHLKFENIKEDLQALFNNQKIGIVGQNLKFDLKVLANLGLVVENPIFDTMLESYVYNSVACRHNLDDLSQKYLNLQTVKLKEITDNFKIGFHQIPIETATQYAAQDADYAYQLHLLFQEKMEASLKQVYEDIERPLIKVLQKIETNGFCIDTQLLKEQNIQITADISVLEKEINELAGETFNVNSTKQLRYILFDKMQLPIIKKTPSGQPSTAEGVLSKMADDGVALPKLVLEYRSLFKLKTTYLETLPKAVHPKTSRVHTNFHQAVASTGRLSSSDPNLQNIPIRTAEGKKIRQAFIAPKNKVLLTADYSQIELRILAHLSGDPSLLNAFRENKDIHAATASEIFDIPLKAVNKDQRRAAKAVNFGLIYGMQAFGLAKQLKTSRADAQSYIDRYFLRYPGVASFMENIKQKAKKQGFVETIRGRRLYLNDITSSNKTLREYAERTAINAPMQGSSADIIKLAMIELDAYCKNYPSEIKIILQVHDELVFEVSVSNSEEKETIKREISDIMENVCPLSVPLLVDAQFGQNWDESH